MRKTKAPFYLFGFMSVVVCCIIASVVIALKNPAIEDHSYFVSKKHIDSEINTLIREQNWFLKHHEITLRVIGEQEQSLKLIPPYLQKNTQKFFEIQSGKPYALSLLINGSKLKDLDAHLYLESVNTAKPTQDLGAFAQKSLSTQILIPHKGRYKAVVVINYQRENETKKLFFERELFVL
ncbi:hypothetical protein [Helicobacter pametensis]|uniref:hypothetical protein n=1 Tax=Helicobacter pametensis TaxID=95149 RepID=UPI000480A506|nr:hypothetical protein [Helicobacter pametensis]